MTPSYKYVFPAIMGYQAGRKYYVAMCPLNLLPKIFLFNEEELPPDLRAQRTLNKARIPEIKRYILNNPNDYAFSAITASVDGSLDFVPTMAENEASDIGHLEISMDAKFLINDGQHRKAAIEAALLENSDLGLETIAVVFFADENLNRSKQLFADLNKHAIKPSKSLNILYDNRDPLACLIRDLLLTVPIFKGLIEKEKTTISNRSIKLFTLSGVYQGTQALLGKRKGEELTAEDISTAEQYWTELGRIIPEWKLIISHKVNSSELRRDYVHSHNVILHAFGHIGNNLINQYPDQWKKILKKFRGVDWSRTNPDWEGRAMVGGRMSKANQNVKLTSNLLKSYLGIELSENEIELEKQFNFSN